MASHSHRDGGFTLIELLVALTLLGIVMAPLGLAMSIVYRTTDETSNRLSSSSDAQFLTIYLPPDIKSADSGINSGITCSGTTAPVLKLTSNANADAVGELASAAVIVYWVKTVTGGLQLVRSVCTTGTAASSTVVSRNLTSASATAIAPAKGFSITVTAKKARTESAAYSFTVSGRFRDGIST